MTVRTTDRSGKGFGVNKVYRGRSLPFYSTQRTGGGTSLPPPPLPSIVLDGLVLNLDAGNTSSYSGTGDTWTDLSGNGNNATLTNGPTYSSANGGSLVFGSTNDYAELSASSSFNFSTGDFSIECWFNISGNSELNGNTTRDACLFNCGSLTSVTIIFAALVILGNSTTTGTSIQFYKNQGGVVDQSKTVSISQNSWHQVVVSRIGTSLNFYLDNSQVGSTITDSNAWGSSTSNSRIGTLNSTGSFVDNFQGSIPIVRIYNGKGLTAAEVQQNYNALVGRFSPSIVLDGLVLNLDAGNTSSYSGTGDTWTDLSGNGNNATRTNSSEVVYNSNGWFDWTDGPASDTTQGCFTLPGSSFTLGANFTIEVWNYYDAASTPNSGSNVQPWNDGCLWTNSASADWSSGAGNNNGFLFGYNSFVYRNTSGTEIQVDYSTNPTTQTWHQHVVVVNSGTGTVYVDKSSVATLSNFRTIGQSNGTLGIGIADLFAGSYRGEYNGYISIVRVYTKALSAQEIQQNYDAVNGRYGL